MAPSVVDWALAGEIVNTIPQRTRNTARMKNLPAFTEILLEDDCRNTPTLAALRTAVCGDRNARGIRGHPTPYLTPPTTEEFRSCMLLPHECAKSNSKKAKTIGCVEDLRRRFAASK